MEVIIRLKIPFLTKLLGKNQEDLNNTVLENKGKLFINFNVCHYKNKIPRIQSRGVQKEKEKALSLNFGLSNSFQGL